MLGIALDGNIVRAGSGADWDTVVRTSIDAGPRLALCRHPGSAGATPVQNVGAYGAEAADTLTRVRLLDRGHRANCAGGNWPNFDSATAPAS